MPAQTETKRKLAGILSADVVGYSRLMQADEQATVDANWRRGSLIGTTRGYGGGGMLSPALRSPSAERNNHSSRWLYLRASCQKF